MPHPRDLPYPVSSLAFRLSREGRANRKAEALEEAVEREDALVIERAVEGGTSTYVYGPRIKAQERLDAHMDKHRDRLGDHPQWASYYDQADLDRDIDEYKREYKAQFEAAKERITPEE